MFTFLVVHSFSLDVVLFASKTKIQEGSADKLWVLSSVDLDDQLTNGYQIRKWKSSNEAPIKW